MPTFTAHALAITATRLGLAMILAGSFVHAQPRTEPFAPNPLARLIEERRWSLLASACEGGGANAVPAALRPAIATGLAEDVAERIRRHDTEGVSAELDACARLATALADQALRSRCRELRIEVLQHRASVAMLRAHAALGSSELRRLESWVRWRARALGWAPRRLERELSEGPTGPALRALLSAHRRPLGDADFRRLESLFGPRPTELTADLARPRRDLPWAALRQARLEVTLARNSLDEARRLDHRADEEFAQRLGRLASRVQEVAERLRESRRRALRRVAPTPENTDLRRELGLLPGTPANPLSPAGRIVFINLPGGPPESLERISLLASWTPFEVRAWELHEANGNRLPWTFEATRESEAGGPHLAYVRWTLPRRGRFRLDARLTAGGTLRAEIDPTHRARGERRDRPEWTPGLEALYSAWIRHLTEVPEGTRWPSLHHLLGERSRNLLHGARGLGEDDTFRRDHFEIRPDCADLSPALRLYFSWKLGLPMAIPRCERVHEGLNHCEEPQESLHPGAGVSSAQSFIDESLDRLTTDVLREDFWSDRSLLYPVPLRREALRPGTVYVDPFGHTLTLARWLPENADGGRVLLAIDAQPGGIVTLKRYWPGYFVFAPAGAHAGAGFRAFRPVRRREGWAMFPTNAQLELEAPGAPLSYEQASMTGAEFRDRMDALLQSRPRDPRAVFEENLGVLHQMLEARALSTDQAEQWYTDRHGEVVPMPAGSSVFATTGLWEDLATICRDLRLAVALRLVHDLRASFRRDPSRYALGEAPTATLGALEAQLTAATEQRAISFRGSSGATHTRTVAAILANADFLEMGYNPNDCAEVRWGLGTAGCRRRAPADQQRQMRDYLRWFRNGYGCD